jgi:release factor glutamine methyltransferase
MTTTMPGAGPVPAAGAEETVGFGPLTITFDDRVLRPRPWTAAQSRWAAELLDDAPPGPVLELCAGAGHIGLLATCASARRLVCVDVNPAACELTLRNAAAAGMADRVEVREGPMDEVLRDSERFALVVADPPWVPRADVGRYPEDPLLAIDGGEDGLDLAWTCVQVAGRHLMPRGSLVLQLGTVGQVDLLRDRLRGASDSADLDLDLDVDLEVTEVRWCERGVLVRLDRA